MLDDPSIVKVIFREYDKKKEVEVLRDQSARLACVMLTVELKPHVEIIDLAPGVYHIVCRKRDIPRKIWFETTCKESYLPKQKPGRYD